MSKRGKGKLGYTQSLITDKETFVPLFFLVLLFSIVLGFMDWGSNGWSTSFLNPASATPTILALILISFMPKRPSRMYKSLIEASLWSAVVLHILHIITLYMFHIHGMYLGLVYTESMTINGDIYSVISISPVVIMIIYYYRASITMWLKSLLKR